MVVLEEYIQLWRDVEGYLDILDTDFFEQYKGTKFSKYESSYNSDAPMFAGFNLKNIAFGQFFQSDMMFLAVNFTGANFTHTELPYTSFNDCNFTDSNLSGANFNQCRFSQCNFEGVDLSKTDLCGGEFVSCIMFQTRYNKKAGLWIHKCFEYNLLTASHDGKLKEVMRLVKTFPDLIHSRNVAGNTPLHLAVIKGQVEIIDFLLKNGSKIDAVNNYGLKPFRESLRHVPHYPFFLQHLKVKPKQLTAEKVANALWLSDKNVKTTNASKSEFGLWANKQDLQFNQDDIEKCLSSYVMNK